MTFVEFRCNSFKSQTVIGCFYDISARAENENSDSEDDDDDEDGDYEQGMP
jgi:hypothetical protein